MIIPDKKYTLEEIKVGMEVGTNQLSSIYDTYILLENVRMEEDRLGFKYWYGKIAEISKNHLCITRPNTVKVYHNSLELEKCFSYDYSANVLQNGL